MIIVSVTSFHEPYSSSFSLAVSDAFPGFSARLSIRRFPLCGIRPAPARLASRISLPQSLCSDLGTAPIQPGPASKLRQTPVSIR